MATTDRIARANTAMHRREASKPMRLAVEHGIITPAQTVLDYGCGRGADVSHLRSNAVEAWGWDPVHRPEGPKAAADVVHLGYVVNVIESPPERRDTLLDAWSLARQVLVVAARLVHERRLSGQAFEDGLQTSRGTFQKFYEQQELRNWIENVLGVPAVAACPGVFYVFRSSTEREAFTAARFRRRVAAPRLRKSELLFTSNEALFAPLLTFMEDRGRPPSEAEVDLAALVERVGSVKKAVSVLNRVFGSDHWALAAAARQQDLLVYLALSRFGGRPRAKQLPTLLAGDIRAFFGTYVAACRRADDLLYKAGDRSALEGAMGQATGKLTPGALYIHRDYLGDLPPVLRVYERCAHALIGDVPEANIVKLSRSKYQVSYLTYPTFDQDPHPALHHSVVVNYRDLDVSYRVFDGSANPPVLHRKETFLGTDDPRYAKFHRLTLQEERWGLLDETASIGTRVGWEAVLAARGARLTGHRLVRVGKRVVSS